MDLRQVGSHMDSSSASDPSFWLVHPSQERLLHATMLATRVSFGSSDGGDNDDDADHWPLDAVSEYVCDTAICYDELTFEHFSIICRFLSINCRTIFYCLIY